MKIVPTNKNSNPIKPEAQKNTKNSHYEHAMHRISQLFRAAIKHMNPPK